MGENPLDFNKKILKKAKKYYNRINILTTILIIVSVCFFYSKGVDIFSSFRLEAQGYDAVNELTMKNTDEWYFEKFKGSFEKNESEDSNNIIPDLRSKEFEKDLASLTEGFPIEEMAPYIAQYDKKIAGLIVGIAKKESNWGKRSPSKNGKTCYNYWGYKGAGELGTSMGYGCFASPEEAVSAIGGRISELASHDLDTPSKIVVWKCGRSCAAAGGQAAANKWISDVNVYYTKIVNS